MLVLGINAAYHESAAAIVRDGRIVMAIEEERLTRVKHAKRARADNPDALPWNAIEQCLDAAGARLRDVDAIGYSLAPRRCTSSTDSHPLEARGSGTEEGEAELDRRVRGVPALIAARANAFSLAERVELLPHHLCHAASAFHTSPFESAAVLVVDGIGENATAWLGRARGPRLQRIEEVPYPHSIGMLWERLSRWLGFEELDAGKVMGLAAFGEASLARDAMRAILRVPDLDGGAVGGALPFEVDPSIVQHRDLEGLERVLGPRREREPILAVPRFAAAAAALQERTEEALLATARRLARATGETRLVYAGGVALNCIANARLEREGPFASVYVPGPAHDAGTALGAALALCARFGEKLVDPRPASAMLGPAYDDHDVQRAILAAGVRATRVADPSREAAERIAVGAIVGWFQDRLELGPRALGNRSLLADPRRPDVRARLNRDVKDREPFRPFAAACLAEAAPEWLELPVDRPGAAASRELMLLAYPIREGLASRVPAVVHRDGTCRIQTVDAARHPRFHALIARFAELTGVPLVLNTSFNRGEPIVGSPEDALAMFARGGIDALFLGDHLVERS